MITTNVLTGWPERAYAFMPRPAFWSGSDSSTKTSCSGSLGLLSFVDIRLLDSSSMPTEKVISSPRCTRKSSTPTTGPNTGGTDRPQFRCPGPTEMMPLTRTSVGPACARSAVLPPGASPAARACRETRRAARALAYPTGGRFPARRGQPCGPWVSHAGVGTRARVLFSPALARWEQNSPACVPGRLASPVGIPRQDQVKADLSTGTVVSAEATGKIAQPSPRAGRGSRHRHCAYMSHTRFGRCW